MWECASENDFVYMLDCKWVYIIIGCGNGKIIKKCLGDQKAKASWHAIVLYKKIDCRGEL